MFFWIAKLFAPYLMRNQASSEDLGSIYQAESQPDNIVHLPVPATQVTVEGEDLSDNFLLDDPAESLAEILLNTLVNQEQAPFHLSAEMAYDILVTELMRRGMTMMCLSKEVFLRQWREGVLTKREWRMSSSQLMYIYGCQVDDFTKVAEGLVRTAKHDPPLVTESINCLGRRYNVDMAYSKIISVRLGPHDPN